MEQDQEKNSFLREGLNKPALSEKSVTSSRHWLEIRDVMSHQVVTVSPEDTVVQAAQKMGARNISCVVVVENGRVVGIFTERDLLQRVVAKGVDYSQKKIREAMTSSVQSIPPSMSILDASLILETKKIRRLPVMENEQLLGIVTQTDLTRALASYGMWRSIGDIMSRDVTVIQQDATVWEAATLMTERRVSCVLVLEGERVAGILTERDTLRKVVALQKNPRELRIKDVMSAPVLSLGANQSIFAAIKMIEENKIRRVVVMEGSQLQGILTQTDIFKAVKNKLEEEESKHVNVLEQSENGIYTVDLKGITTYVNPAFMRILEIENRSDLVGQEFLPERFWTNPKDRVKLLGRLRRGGGVEIEDLVLQSANGRKRFVTLFWTVTKNVSGEVNGNQGILYDITEKKELVTLREAEEKLRKSNESLQKISELKSEFVSMVAHELRTPMTVIRGRVDLVLGQDYGPINESQRMSLQVVLEHIDRLSRMINNLLDLAKIEAGKFELKCDWVDLAAVVRFANESFSFKAREKNLELKFEVSEGKIAYADEDRLVQVLSNLLGNAIKFTERGEIKVSILEKEEVFECVVADTGPGISEDEMEKIFDKFEQSKRQQKVPEKGTGLGLSIAREIVTMHGGKIWMTSKFGIGTQFHFTIPKLSVVEIFRRTMEDAIRGAMEKDIQTSVVMVPVELFPGEGPEVSPQLWLTLMQGLKIVIERMFRRGADMVVRGERQLMIVLVECSEENLWRALERFQTAMKTFLKEQGLRDRVKMSFAHVTYPEDGGNDAELFEKLVGKVEEIKHIA